MHYFVTGATGFIGKRLVKKLLARKGAIVYFLMREESQSAQEPDRPLLPLGGGVRPGRK